MSSDEFLNNKISNLYDTRNYDLNNFLLSIEFLYSNKPDCIKAANSYLNRFNTNPSAFLIAINALSLNDLNEKVYLSSINIIKNKLRLGFANYSNDFNTCNNMKNIIIQCINKFKNKLKLYVIESLCQCYAYLILFSFKIISDIFESFTNNICYEENAYDLKTNNKIILYLFTALGDIPLDKTIVVDIELLNEFKSFLRDNTSDIMLKFIYNILINNNFNCDTSYQGLNKDILKTLISWLDFGLSDKTKQSLLENYSNIVNFIFDISEENLNYHKNCICMLMLETSSSSMLRYKNSNNINHKIEELKKIIITKVASFEPIVNKAIESNNQEAIDFFIDIFDAVCSQNLTELINNSAVKVFYIIYRLTELSNENKLSYLCDFWEIFIKHILNFNSSDELYVPYLEIIDKVIIVISNKSKWSKSIFEKINKSQYKDFKDDDNFVDTNSMRVSIKEFFNNIGNVMSFKKIYNSYFKSKLEHCVISIKNNMTNINNWIEFESIMYVFSCLVRFSTSSDLDDIERVLVTCYEVPLDLVQINRTISDTIDELSHMLNKLPNLLNSSFAYLVNSLDKDMCRYHSLISLNKLLHENRNYFKDYLNDLIKVYKDKIFLSILKDEDCVEYLTNITSIIFSTNNIDIIKENVIELSTPWVKKIQTDSNLLHSLLDNNNKDSLVDKNYISDLAQSLYIFKGIISSGYETYLKYNSKDIQQLLCTIFYELWNSLKILLLVNYQVLVENCIQVTKVFMRTMKFEYFNSYLQEFFKIVVEGYTNKPYASYLYCLEIAICVFAYDLEDDLKLILEKMFVVTYKTHLISKSDLDDNPQLTIDLFGILFRSMKINPLIIMDNNFFEDMLKTAIDLIDIKHPECAINIAYFLQKIFNFKKNPVILNQTSEKINLYITNFNKIIHNYGQTLVTKIFNYIVEVPLQPIFEQLIKLISNLYQNCQESCAWFREATIKVHESILTNIEKDKLINSIKQFIEYLDKLNNLKACDENESTAEKLQDDLAELDEKIEAYIYMMYKRSINYMNETNK